MKSPVLLCSVISALALSACNTAPSDRATTLRRGNILVIENKAAPTAAPVSEPAAAVVAVPAAPVVVTSPPVSLAPEPTPVAPVVVAPVTPEAPPAPEPKLEAVRTGTKVLLTWVLPASPSGYRAIEIMRNTSSNATGRGRVNAVRASATALDDTLPDAQANYWYWLKVTPVEGAVMNIGPIAAPVQG